MNPTNPTSTFLEFKYLNNNKLNKKTLLEKLSGVVGFVGFRLKKLFPTNPTEFESDVFVNQKINPLLDCWTGKRLFSFLVSPLKWLPLPYKRKSDFFWIGLPIMPANEKYFFEDGCPIYGRIFWIEKENRLKHTFFTSKMEENHLKMMIKMGMIFMPKITKT